MITHCIKIITSSSTPITETITAMMVIMLSLPIGVIGCIGIVGTIKYELLMAAIMVSAAMVLILIESLVMILVIKASVVTVMA